MHHLIIEADVIHVTVLLAEVRQRIVATGSGEGILPSGCYLTYGSQHIPYVPLRHHYPGGIRYRFRTTSRSVRHHRRAAEIASRFTVG